MIRVPRDRTLPLLGWIFLLGITGLWFIKTRELPVLAQAADEKINLNQATLGDLMVIPRLNIKVARAILELRDQRVKLKNFEELESIPGVGPKTIEKLKQLVKIF